MTPDPNKTYLVNISGGKDSTAMWLYLKRDLGLPNLIPMFSDTGWEHPLTYEYLDYLEQKLGPLVRVKYDLDFVGLAAKKGIFPSTKTRFCTQKLKMEPARDWINAQLEAGAFVREDLVQCSGVRHEESPARAKMGEWVEKDDYHGLKQWRPILTWTWQEVFAMHDKHDVKPNPLYKLGMGRVGCMPCIMSNLPELGEIARRFPEVVDKVEAAEERVEEFRKASGRSHRQASFFHAETIPERFRSRTYVLESGETVKVCMARDVFEYAKLEKPERLFGGAMTPLFTEPENEDLGVCSSIYGLCE